MLPNPRKGEQVVLVFWLKVAIWTALGLYLARCVWIIRRQWRKAQAEIEAARRQLQGKG